MEVIGSIYTEVSDDFQKGIIGGYFNRRIADMQNYVVETKIASVTERLLLMMILAMITRKKINGSKSNRSNG